MMEQKRISMWLKAVGLVAMAGLVFEFFVFAPRFAALCAARFEQLVWLRWPALAGLWAVGLLYLASVVFYLRICARIGRDQSFVPDNARDLARIAQLMLGAAGLWGAGCLGVLWVNIGPGGIWIGALLMALASGAIATLAWALGKLVRRAVRLQEENDLTV